MKCLWFIKCSINIFKQFFSNILILNQRKNTSIFSLESFLQKRTLQLLISIIVGPCTEFTSAYWRQPISQQVRIVAPIKKANRKGGRPNPPWNTLLTVVLPHRGIPYSPWIYPTTEHPTHCEPAPPWNTLLTKVLTQRGTPYSPRTFLTQNTLLTLDLLHRGTPYSPWKCPTAEHPIQIWTAPCRTPYSPYTCPKTEHPTQSGPAPLCNTQLTLDLPHMEHPTHSMKEHFWREKIAWKGVRHIYGHRDLFLF